MFLTKTFSSKPMTVCGVLFILVAPTRLANAAELQEARVSQVIQDVRLLEAHAAPHAAAVNDKVIKGSAVRTGVESRAELTFNDLTITRLGANTIFSFTAGARQAELTQGAILLQVRPNAPPVRANTTAVTVAVMGGTALLSTGPPTKFMVLEGTGTIYPLGHPEKAVTVHGGEMVIADGGRVSKPDKFDVKLVLATSPLITDFAPLTNLPLILAVVDQQVAEQQVVVSSRPPYKSFTDTIDVTDQSANANPPVVQVRTGTPTPSTTPSPSGSPTPPPPTPSKFGTPTTITSPNPYVITSGTTITTDPSITTNGVTDFGKIYRGPTDDGAFSLWAFGSTSAFDTALNLDTQFFANPSRLPIAVFKLQSLLLNGNPAIDLSNGGVTKLALIGVDGITSGSPGGTLTFTGLDLLALATVNGSINLTSDVSFQNLNELAMYARGAGSNLTLDSPISGIGLLELAAEGSILLFNPGTMSVGAFHTTAGENLTLDIGGSLMLNGSVNLDTLVLPGTTVADAGNLTLSVHTDLTNDSTTDLLRGRVTNFQGQIGTGGNILVGIGGNFTTGNDAEFLIQNTAGTITNGGNIVFGTGGSISTGGEFSLLIENYDETANPAGHIGTGGNISLTTGGDFSADFASIALNNRGGGVIDSGVNLTINIGGALTTLENGPDFLQNTASLSVAISTRYDDTAGNTQASAIGGDATLSLHADSASIGGILNVFVSNRGGTIGGNALLNFNVTHDVTVSGADIPNINDATEIELLNGGGTSILSPLGGTIHGDATLLFSSENLSVPNGSMDVLIENSNRGVTGGSIGGNAIVTLSAASISINQNFDAEIDNQRGHDATGSNGGSIVGVAALTISASSLSVGGELNTLIENFNSSVNTSGTGGNIAGSALLSLDTSGNISVTNDFNALIENQRAAGIGLGPSGGSIGSDAILDITSGAVSVGGSLDVEIRNRNNGSGSGAGGSIGRNAAINLNLAGNLSVQGAASVLIANESLVAGSGGIIHGNAAVNFNVGNTASSGSAAYFQIFNQSVVAGSPGGSIGGDATVDVSVGDLTSGADQNGNALVVDIDNRGGSIVGNEAVTLAASGSVDAQGNAFLQVLNFNDGTSGPGTIGGDATLNVSAASLSTAGFLYDAIDNSSGGSITGSANSTFTLTGDLMTQGDANFTIGNSDGGTIGGNAAVGVNAANITANSLVAQIDNARGGSISGSANLNLTLTADLTTQGDASFIIFNTGSASVAGGTIGSDAVINLSANNISTGGLLDVVIDNNPNGGIHGGSIGGDATINVIPASITANSLLAQIDNSAGSIGANTEGGATINMNVSGTATVTNDATVAIYGSDGAVGGAAININSGNYNVGGTFLSYIDGNGTITFNNATAHADVLKAGVFGANGVLNIGGGILSADSELKLYAPGSNGQLNFVSNVTLGGNSLKILAADSVTIFNNVVVTIGGPNAADVYTNHANYTGFGGNGTTTGTFAGAGANNPQPLANAPPFGPATPSHYRPPHFNGPPQINVSNTEELLALLDGAAVGPDGRITVPASQRMRDLRHSGRTDINALRREAGRILMQQMRDRSITRVGNRRIL